MGEQREILDLQKFTNMCVYLDVWILIITKWGLYTVHVPLQSCTLVSADISYLATLSTTLWLHMRTIAPSTLCVRGCGASLDTYPAWSLIPVPFSIAWSSSLGVGMGECNQSGFNLCLKSICLDPHNGAQQVVLCYSYFVYFVHLFFPSLLKAINPLHHEPKQRPHWGQWRPITGWELCAVRKRAHISIVWPPQCKGSIKNKLRSNFI